MNATLVKDALEKVLDPDVLVNLISRRVRQLIAGLGSEISAEGKAGPAPGGQRRPGNQ
jgi:hypothetical protein